MRSKMYAIKAQIWLNIRPMMFVCLPRVSGEPVYTLQHANESDLLSG